MRGNVELRRLEVLKELLYVCTVCVRENERRKTKIQSEREEGEG